MAEIRRGIGLMGAYPWASKTIADLSVRGIARTEASDEVTWNFDHSTYDHDLERYYWEGKRATDGRMQ